MTAAQAIGLAIQLSMALIIFCVALDARFADLAFVWRKPGLLLRSLISMLVVMPVVAALMVVWFDLNHAVEIALIASALSPVPPILPNKQMKAGGEGSYVVGLLTTSALVSIGYIPLAAQLLQSMFSRPIDVSVANITRIVMTSILLPVLAGMAVRHLAPALAKRIDKPLSIFATVVLVLACIPILFNEWPKMARLVGDYSIVMMAMFALTGMAAGHLLGGPDPDRRSVLALATAARHPAVALAISHNAFDQPGVMAAVLLLLLVSSVVAIPYVKWSRRHHDASVAHGGSPPS